MHQFIVCQLPIKLKEEEGQLCIRLKDPLHSSVQQAATFSSYCCLRIHNRRRKPARCLKSPWIVVASVRDFCVPSVYLCLAIQIHWNVSSVSYSCKQQFPRISKMSRFSQINGYTAVKLTNSLLACTVRTFKIRCHICNSFQLQIGTCYVYVFHYWLKTKQTMFSRKIIVLEIRHFAVLIFL